MTAMTKWKYKLHALVALFLIAALAALNIVSAAEPPVVVEQTRKAETLKQLGLFKGTERGFELELTFTRAQGAVMLLRLMGLEQTSLALANAASPFADVPASHWSNKQVTYAYQQGFIRGTSPETFAPDAEMTGPQFLSLVLRALGYKEAEPNNAISLATSIGMLTDGALLNALQGETFHRGFMVEIAYVSLSTSLKGSGKTLLQKLVEDDKTVSSAAAAKTGLYKASKPSDDPMDIIEEAIQNTLD